LILWLSLALQIVSFNTFLDSMDSSRIQNSRNSARSLSVNLFSDIYTYMFTVNLRKRKTCKIFSLWWFWF
jgi:hypothetical protein